MVFNLKRKKNNEFDIEIIKCKHHNAIERKLSRIEGENIAILAMMAILMLVVVERIL